MLDEAKANRLLPTIADAIRTVSLDALLGADPHLLPFPLTLPTDH